MNILCLESGGTKLVAALADECAELQERRIEMREPGQTAETTLRQLMKMGKGLSQGLELTGVSLGFGGTVDRTKASPTLCYHENGWDQINAHEFLAEAFRVPVFIENDCNLAALAEFRFGAPEPVETLLYVTVGTGIGGGVVHRGKLVELGNLGEAEIGHIVVDAEGPECPCGNHGCLETLCSGPGLENLALRVAGKRIPAKRIMADFKAGDVLSDRICSAAAKYMAEALAPAINLLSPDTIIFGGGVMSENEKYLSKIRYETLLKVFPPFRPACSERFLLTSLRESVVCQGAATFAVQKLRELEGD
jgi:glucokinase